MDKSELTRDRVTTKTATVEIEGVGTITVRGLTRYEFAVSQKKYEDDPFAQERCTLAMAMVDPVMTEADVEAWQKASPFAEINEVAMKVNALSGIGKEAQKEAYKSV